MESPKNLNVNLLSALMYSVQTASLQKKKQKMHSFKF